MANDDRNRPQTAAPRPPTPGEPIKVRSLWFEKEHHLPLSGSFSSTMKRQLIAGETLAIQYEPWIRHHRVRELGPGGEVVREFMVPESWALHVPEAP